MLVSRAVVSDKGPGPSALQKRIPTKTESNEISKLFIRRKNSTQKSRYTSKLGVMASWQFKSLFWGICSRFSLASHLALLGAESVFGLSQGPPTCACAHLSAKMGSGKEAYG